MRAQAHAKRDRGTISGGVSYSRDLLERLVRILVHTGHSPHRLAREFREICQTVKEPRRIWDEGQLAYYLDLAHVIAHWHSDPQYLDTRGMPVPLLFRAKGPCLYALIRRVLPHEEPDLVLRSLVRHKGVRRRGRRYIPSARYFTYRRAVGRIHGLSVLLGMLRTVERNVTGKKPLLIERAALNPSFPARALPSFHRRLETQASKFLWDQDSRMRGLERHDPDGARVRLGVGVFAFEEPVRPDGLVSRGRAEAEPLRSSRHRARAKSRSRR